MSDDKQEKGVKWWTRYVIVPIVVACIGSLGMGAIIVAVIQNVQPPSTVIVSPTNTPTPESIPALQSASALQTNTPVPPTNVAVLPTATLVPPKEETTWGEKKICEGEWKTCTVPETPNGLCALYFYRQGQPGAIEKTFLFRGYAPVSVNNFSGVLYCWQYLPDRTVAAGGNEFTDLTEVDAAGVSFSESIESVDPLTLQ